MNDSIIQTDAGLNNFYAKIYSLVGMGIGISAVVAGLMLTVFRELIPIILVEARWIYYFAIFGELALVIFASNAARRNSAASFPIFIGYSALNGFTLSIIVALYTQGEVFKAFISSSIMFFVMALIGFFTKKDLSGIGRACYAVLFGVIISSVVNFFLGSGAVDYVISFVTVVVFSGLIAWDNQKIRYVYEQVGVDVDNGWVVSMALNIYLDFINLFLSFLRIQNRK